jgi:hypothetical protein
MTNAFYYHYSHPSGNPTTNKNLWHEWNFWRLRDRSNFHKMCIFIRLAPCLPVQTHAMSHQVIHFASNPRTPQPATSMQNSESLSRYFSSYSVILKYNHPLPQLSSIISSH